MSTTDCGTELDLVHEERGTQGRLAVVMLRTKSVWRAFRNRLASNRLHDLDDRQLNDIGIFFFTTKLEHAPVPEQAADIGAGFIMRRHIRQLVGTSI